LEDLAVKYGVSTQVIVDFNYLEEPFDLKEGMELTIPNAKIPAPAPVTQPFLAGPSGVQSAPAGAASGSGNFIWPIDSNYITQYFRSYHPALDIAKNSGPLYITDCP